MQCLVRAATGSRAKKSEWVRKGGRCGLSALPSRVEAFERTTRLAPRKLWRVARLAATSSAVDSPRSSSKASNLKSVRRRWPEYLPLLHFREMYQYTVAGLMTGKRLWAETSAVTGGPVSTDELAASYTFR